MQPQEDVLDYVKRFKQTSDNTKTVAGDRFLDLFIETGEDYKQLESDEAKEDMKKVAFAEFMGFMAIECTNKAQYGTLSKHLTQQFLMNTDQYPKSITAATNILANH